MNEDENENEKQRLAQEEQDSEEKLQDTTSEDEGSAGGKFENSMDDGSTLQDSKKDKKNEKESKLKRGKDDYDKLKEGKKQYDKLKKADEAGKAAKAAEAANAANAASAGTAAAGGATAGGAAAGGAAAGGAAAGGAAAGGAVAAGAAVLWPLLIVLLIILLIIILIGIVGFFTTMPQFLINKIKQLAQDIFDDLQGYIIGMDESTVNKDDIIGVAQYLNDMGYDLVGMGFADSVEIYGQRNEKGEMVEIDEDHEKGEIKKVKAPYLRAYLVAENRTYIVNNYTFNIKDFATSIFNGELFDHGIESWGSGMIDLDTNLLEDIVMPASGLFGGRVGELIDGVKIDRSSNTMRIRRWNLELNVFKTHRDYTYYSMEGWTGRYGKPFELLLTLHMATMSPDLVYDIAMDKDLDTKVHIKRHKAEFNGSVYVDGKSIDELESEGTYDDKVIKNLRKVENDYASEIKLSIPYISSVTDHWFRNVYFEGTDSEDGSSSIDIGIDEDDDGLEDYNEKTGEKTQKTRKLSSSDNVYTFGEEQEDVEFEYAKEIDGVTGKVTFKGTVDSGVTQTKDAVRGTTNPRTKEIFNQKYYVYDGTITRAKQIQKARILKDDSLKQKINFSKDSLSAFAMLEQTETLDAQFIYRDLKELVIELGYFEREDFNEIEKQVLEWPIPDYIPGEWPDRKIEKQEIDYGTLIASDETIAKSLGMSLEDLQSMTGTKKDEEEQTNQPDEDELNTLKGTLFIGDSYISGLEQYAGISDATFKGQSGATPQYWINNTKTLPEDKPSKICVYLGVNNPTDYQPMKDFIDILVKRYENTPIYIIEVMHLGKNYTTMDVDAYNKKIDTYNSQIREKCKTMSNVTFIDASKGLISGGYLANPDNTGVHFANTEDYSKFAKNIALEIKDTRKISTNDTNETFVVNFLNAAKEISTYIKENNFESGNAEFMPPQNDGTTTADGKKVITTDRFISWALNKCGYKDQPECGLTVGENGDFIDYCEEKGWKRITDSEQVHAGDIVFEGKLDEDGKKASKVYICAGNGKRYEVEDNSQITGDQPIEATIGSDFLCAYRVTGGNPISSGFVDGLDVIAMGNGRIVEKLDSSNNLFSLSGVAQQLNGTSLEGETTDEHALDGLRIKLTDAALKGYTLIIYGFDVDEGITVGQNITVNDVIGKTTNADICMILLDRDRAVLENIEEYIKVPRKVSNASNSGSSQEYKANPGDDVILANMMHFEGCTNTWQASTYGSHSKEEADTLNMITGYVLLNRAIVNYGGYGTTIVEQLKAPGQYATAYAADNQEIECLECYENAQKCLQYDCDYVKNPNGVAMARNVLGQSGWDQCPDNSVKGKNCFWWVDTNSNGVADEYVNDSQGWDTFFCYNDAYAKFNK